LAFGNVTSDLFGLVPAPRKAFRLRVRARIGPYQQVPDVVVVAAATATDALRNVPPDALGFVLTPGGALRVGVLARRAFLDRLPLDRRHALAKLGASFGVRRRRRRRR